MMRTGSREAACEALTATVAGALQQRARRSAHPADAAERCRTAARIALALQAEFVFIQRLAAAAEPPDRTQLSEPVHE